MGVLRRGLDLFRLVLAIIFYAVLIGVAFASLYLGAPTIVIASLASAIFTALGLGFTITQYGLRLIDRIVEGLVRGTFFLVSIRYGPLRTVVLLASRGSVDIAIEAQRLVGILGFFFKIVLIIGPVVGALVWVPEQSAIQNGVDLVGCQVYVYVRPVFELLNRFIDFYNSIAESLNVLGAIFFEFAEDVFLAFLDLVWEGLVLIFRLVANPEGSLDNCTVFVPGQATPEICPMGTGGNYASASTCVVEELFCWSLRLLDFIIVDVLERFLRILFPPIIADSVTNVLEATLETYLLYLDIYANAFVNPVSGLPFVGCSASIPSGTVGSANIARQCFNNRGICPPQRLLCNRFYWFKIIFSTGSNFLTLITEFFDNVLSDVFPPFLGRGIFTRILDFVGLIDVALDIVRRFEEIVNMLIRFITDPIQATLDALNLAFNTFRDLLTGNPIAVLNRLPAQLLTLGNPLGRQLLFLLEFIQRVEIITQFLDRAIGALRSIVSAISSGGGVFGRRLLSTEGFDGIPLNPPEEWIVEIEDRIGIYNLTGSVVYSLIEIFNNSLHHECNIDPHTVERLEVEMDWLPSIQNLGKEAMTPGQADVVRYMITRDQCAAGEISIHSPEYHLRTMSPRLDPDSTCYPILGNEAIRHALAGDTESEWWTEWYLPCAGMYMSSKNETGHDTAYSWMYAVDDEKMRSGMVGYLQMQRLKKSWNDLVGYEELAEDRPLHLFEKSSRQLTPEEHARINAEFFTHVTRPRSMHKAQAKIDRARAALAAPRNQTRRPKPEWGLEWGMFRFNTTRQAQPIRQKMMNRTRLDPRQLLQVSVERTYNFTEDVIRPLAEFFRKLVTALLFILARFLRAVGAELYATFLEGVIELMRTFEIQSAILLVRTLILNLFDSAIMALDCDYNVIDNPLGDYTLGCLTRLQFPPELPKFPEDSQSFLIQWGSPCRGPLQNCQYNTLIPDTDTFLDDITSALFIVVTEGQCPAGYESCSLLGFEDQFDFAAYSLELATEETQVDLLGFFRSSLYSTLTVSQANFIGTTLLPVNLLPGISFPFLTSLASDFRAATSLRDLRYFAEFFFRFENGGNFPRSEFHDFCLGWGYGLIPGASIIVIAVLIVQVLFLSKIIPITTRIIGLLLPLFQSPLFIFDMADEMLIKQTLGQTIIVRKEYMPR